MSIIPHGPIRSVLALVLGLCFGVGIFLLTSRWEGQMEQAEVQELPVGMELQSLRGTQQPLAMITAEKPAVVVVFSSWCRYCKPVLRDAMRFNALATQEGVGVYAVNYGETPEKARQVVASLGLDMPVLLDEDKEFAKAVGLNSVPRVFGVAQGGAIRFEGSSLPPESEWAAFIGTLR
ncbi:hypothetical protein DPQ33_16850 [Oceanidesulfovibrio indonesiensis]|uniref:Redoxin domain-containing protein n=1 Tax=Oceanidesulfovibrio indonesiensis TaxID=54767 RepID=A0A7M3MAF3_9BACT|nr:TlpA disulfide reductase family protein [Oceanidesulfovibrio indonesiensis]TVM14677.1 hypothetical protein DPQ33_16850 [Oceanidesulfovibrio indonesiensis]